METNKCERCKKIIPQNSASFLDTHWVYKNHTGGITDKWTCFECQATLQMNYIPSEEELKDLMD